MAFTHTDVVTYRIKQSQAFDQFRRKVYDLRRLVAGDYSSIMPAPSASPDEHSITSTDLYDFIVLQVSDGRSNKLLQTIKTLMMQTGYYFPEIEFENLNPTPATLNAEYCKQRLGEAPRGCNARDHMRLSLLDYMVGGIGWVKACIRDDRPALVHCDTLDMTWDRTARLPCEIKWASCKYREPLHVWIDMFGSKSFQTRLIKGDYVGPEQVVELEWYYDVDGPDGSWYVFDTQNMDEPIHKGTNPYYFMDANRKMPYIPYEPMYLLQLPSLRLPIGLAEMMLPHQIGVWEAETNIKTTIQRGAPFYQVTEGALNDEEKQKFEDGDIGTIVEMKPNMGSIIPSQGINVSPQVMQWREMNNIEIISQGGANPYAAGAPVQGVSYAAEVNAIEGNSGLMAGNIAKDLAAFWQRAVRKFLGAAKLYDDQPILLTVDGADLTFDGYNPIKRFLRPDADVLVKESTMQFKPREQKIQEALLKLQTSQAMAQIFPKAPAMAFEDYLVALGEKNPTAWLEQAPQPMAPQQLPQEMDPQMNQGA